MEFTSQERADLLEHVADWVARHPGPDTPAIEFIVTGEKISPRQILERLEADPNDFLWQLLASGAAQAGLDEVLASFARSGHEEHSV